MIDLFKILMEKFQRCLCLDNLKKNENRLKNKNLDIYTFEFLQPHARLVCLPTNIFVLQDSVDGSGMFLNLLQKRKRSIIHGKASVFAFVTKA